MKCPTCGAPNKSTNKACYRCGWVLDDRSVQPRGTANSLWYSPAEEKKEREAPPPFWGDTSGRPTYEDKSDFIVLHDEESEENAAQDLVDRGAPVPDNRKKLSWMEGKREVRVIVPAKPRPVKEGLYPGRRYKIRWRRLILSAMAILLLSVGAGYGVFLLYRVAVGAASQLFVDSRDNADGQKPLVEKVTIGGAGWHKITFFGKDGDVVLLNDPKRSMPIKDGKAELMLEDQNYISADLTVDAVTVSLEGTLISPDGKNTPILVDPYVIDVPLAPLKIVVPSELQNITTDCDSVYVKIKVTPGSKRVMIGDTNVTDKVNAEGYASATVMLEPDCVNTIIVSADTANYRKNVQELKVDRPVMQVRIQLLDNPATSTTSSTVKIKGVTEANATVTSNASQSVTVDKNGNFSFTANLKGWGWNDIKITATSAGGQTSTMTHRVNHVAQDPYYSSHAYLLTATDYDYLLAHTVAVTGRIYCLTGTFVNKIENETAEYYLFDSGDQGSPRYVVVENTTSADIKIGPVYRIFVDVKGESVQNYPVLVLRQSYWLLEKSPGVSASPGASSSPGASASPAATN
jgi:hypothetical protein